jgi:uncharacterized cupredoxin-like copper-binding protein
VRRLLALIPLGATALLAGCGGADPFVTDRDGVVRLELTDTEGYRIIPENVRVREGRIRIVARNRGILTHNVRVTEIERDIGEEVTDYGTTETAQPGQVVGRTVTLGPGRYKLVCTIGNHDDLGQYGELRVTPKENGS